MHSSKHTEHYRKNKTEFHMYETPTLLPPNTFLTGQKQETVGFPQRKQLPRLSANSSVSITSISFYVMCRFLL